MRPLRVIFPAAFLILTIACGESLAQEGKVKVGITVLGNAAGITAEAGRDRLVKGLNKQKKGQVEAIPLESNGGAKISDEARAKNCLFVVFPTLTEAHAESQATGKPGQTTNIPEYYTTIEYKVYRLSDATVVATGSAVAHDIGSQGEVVQQAIDRLVGKVAADIKTAATAAPAATAVARDSRGRFRVARTRPSTTSSNPVCPVALFLLHVAQSPLATKRAAPRGAARNTSDKA